MKCTVCKRELAPTLSICYACGTMVNDSVREELATKIGRISKPLDVRVAVEADRIMTVAAVSEPPKTVRPVAAPNPPAVPRPRRSDPTERINRHTSQTLVEFQNKNSDVPDWRIQLKNAIRQRKTEDAETPAPPAFPIQVTPKASAAQETKATAETVSHSNPKVAKALQRIEESRRRFSNAAARKTEGPAPTAKNYPFNVVSRSEDVPARTAARPATVNVPPKPRLVMASPVEPSAFGRKGYDTNKLPPLPEVAPLPVTATPVEPEPEPRPDLQFYAEPEEIEIRETELKTEPAEEGFLEDDYDEDIDDLASFSARFTANIFDLIVGGFATAIVMSPALVQGGDWFSVLGVLTIAAAFGIVMFTYLTIAVGLRGRTLGMKIFSLEVIDIEENEYPTFHQAAVSSAVYLLSLPLLGIGFLPAFFNEERRAAHDLISGTLLVREV